MTLPGYYITRKKQFNENWVNIQYVYNILILIKTFQNYITEVNDKS